MKTITVSEARLLDKRAMEIYGISALVLMENAGRAVVEEIIRLRVKNIAVFCGKGNNGGDGFVCARQLAARGFDPDVFIVSSVDDVKGDARINLNILLKLGHKVREVNEKNIDLVRRKIRKYDLIVDAIFGVGLKDGIKGFVGDLIEFINSSGAYVISVDIPSGLDADNGKISGPCVKADRTITFIAKKRGMATGSGPANCGKVITETLGLPLL